ncbi:GAF domain-containing sensor histidine kinase [bacterium]|nr:GAF domain-containing sensor histidine kinase [bacterium]
MSSRTSLELHLDDSIIQAARATGLLDTPPEESFERLTRLASQLLKCSVSFVTIIDKDRQFFKSARGLAEPWQSKRETPLSHSFCQHVVASGSSLRIKDARREERFRESPAIPDLGVISYLGVPLRSQGTSVGALCVVESEPREWTDSELNTLEDLAAAAMTEIELRVTSGQLQATVQKQNELLGMAAHDLRNPLMVVRGFAALLASERSGLPESQRKMAESIVRSTRFMSSLVDNILDLQALRVSKLSLHLEQLEASQYLPPILEANRVLAELRGQQLEIGKIEPSTFVADRHKLEQVLNNLLGNAIKYSAPGTTIRFQYRPQPRPQFEVVDQGPGMTAEQIKHIFEPFCRGETHGQTGVGLGLAIVDRIVRGHGGSIEVSSQPGQGSQFTVILGNEGNRLHEPG